MNSAESAGGQRLIAIDWIRGFVMLLMAVDLSKRTIAGAWELPEPWNLRSHHLHSDEHGRVYASGGPVPMLAIEP